MQIIHGNSNKDFDWLINEHSITRGHILQNRVGSRLILLIECCQELVREVFTDH